MPKRSKPQYCTRDIDFPPSLYLGFIWVHDNDGTELLIPASRLFGSTEKTLDYLSELQDTYYTLNRLVDEDILIIPLTFKEKTELKPLHWTNDREERNLYAKLAPYIYAIREHKDSQILVVSQGFEDDFEKFGSAAAMNRDTDDKRLEKIIRNSDTYVDPSSKTAALYLLDTPLAVFPTDNQVRITNFRTRRSNMILH